MNQLLSCKSIHHKQYFHNAVNATYMTAQCTYRILYRHNILEKASSTKEAKWAEKN